MLRPIPRKILKHSATLRVRTGTDVWQSGSYDTIELDRVVVQPEHRVQRGNDNTEVTLAAVCFVDARRSSPAGIDLQNLQNAALAAGSELELVFRGQTYRVMSIDTLYDDEGALHHTEVGLM